MESYRDFLNRIGYRQRELMIGAGAFLPDRSRLFPKVGEDNRFRPFYGDTVVFDLRDEEKTALDAVCSRLYRAAPCCFCEPLDARTFHMTLHDFSAGTDPVEMAPFCDENERKLTELLRRMAVPATEIRMKTDYIINMVGTSLVLMLVPETEDDWNKLEGFYRLLDPIVTCPYPYLTPHITLAYYNRDGFDKDAASALKRAVYDLNGQESREVILSTERLYYQRFTDMNRYVSVCRLCKQSTK